MSQPPSAGLLWSNEGEAVLWRLGRRAFGGGPSVSSQQGLACEDDMQGRAPLMAQLQPPPPTRPPGLGRRPTPPLASLGGFG
jgi:hypothetical protein